MTHINRGLSKVCSGAARGAVMTPPPPPPPTHPPVWGEAEVRCMLRALRNCSTGLVINGKAAGEESGRAGQTHKIG